MSKITKEQIKKIVYTFAKLSNFNNTNEIDNLINRLINMNIDDVMDYLIVSISDLINKGMLTKEDVLSNIDLLTSINKEKYSSVEDLINRLNFLQSMNLEHPQMPLKENHELVNETFDKFNSLIGTSFDSYYTGGLMAYFATNHALERYHGDLDLFINEENLKDLYNLIKDSEDFKFISNMDHKGDTGHEFKIQYKNTPMSIGLFLFERKENEIIIKQYYYKDDELLVNEQHLSKEYADMIFTNDIRYHNNIPYRMQSLESIYNVKKNSREKDKYDANIIKDIIDKNIDHNLDTKKDGNYDVNGKKLETSIVGEIERLMQEDKLSINI